MVMDPMKPLQPITHQSEINRQFMMNATFGNDNSRPPSRSVRGHSNDVCDTQRGDSTKPHMKFLKSAFNAFRSMKSCFRARLGI